MAITSAWDWKRCYAAERARLGPADLHGLLDAAEPLAIEPGQALVIPHTRLEVTGGQIARAVATVMASGADTVLALGVLHGARRVDADVVAAARAGDGQARDALRGVHREDGLAAEEFSLDAYVELLALAAARAGRAVRVECRYPFLVGDDPASLPGLDELGRLVGAGALVVATTDPVHHGHAYDTPAAECMDASDPRTLERVRAMVDEQLVALQDHRFADFAHLAALHRSDFRDTGPVLSMLRGTGWSATVHDLALVDYAPILDAAAPSWVAGALVTV